MLEFRNITDDDLNTMAKVASSLFLDKGVPLESAVIKVATDNSDLGLTSEHVRRLCEKSYHETFVRSFRESDGPDRVVNFDPADPEKVAAAVRAKFIESHHDKVASAEKRTLAPWQEKLAAYQPTQLTPPRDFFAEKLATIPDNSDSELSRREIVNKSKAMLDKLADSTDDLKGRIGVGRRKLASAFASIRDEAKQEFLAGTPAIQVLHSCDMLLKDAGAPDVLRQAVASQLVKDASAYRVQIIKMANAESIVPNKQHPMGLQAEKLATAYQTILESELALEVLTSSKSDIKQVLTDAIS